MYDQLTRIQWRCPSCGREFPVDPSAVEIYCPCGVVKSLTNGDDPEVYKRLITCETCMDYMGGERCKSIELGCRRAFRRELREGSCPRSKWSE